MDVAKGVREGSEVKGASLPTAVFASDADAILFGSAVEQRDWCEAAVNIFLVDFRVRSGEPADEMKSGRRSSHRETPGPSGVK